MATRTAQEDRTLRQVRQTLASAWPWGQPDVEPTEVAGNGRRADVIVRLPTPGRSVRLLVEVKRGLAPGKVAPLAQTLRGQTADWGTDGAMVVAPWLSPQSRRELERAGIGYADETGNLLVQIDQPPVYVRDRGTDRNPAPVGNKRMGLSGVRAGEIVRTLLDVTPPYSADDLVTAIPGISPGTVSKVLAGLAEDDLVDREPYGPITDVDIRGLLDAWSQAYDPSKLNSVYRYVNMYGPRSVAEDLLALSAPPGQWAATGSLVATALAPVAPPAAAKIYTEDPEGLAEATGLIQVDAGTANVLLMIPWSPIVFTRTWVDRRTGMPCVSPAQVVVDLTVGREPQEAEALIDWMAGNPDRWRVDDFDAPSPVVEQVA